VPLTCRKRSAELANHDGTPHEEQILPPRGCPATSAGGKRSSGFDSLTLGTSFERRGSDRLAVEANERAAASEVASLRAPGRERPSRGRGAYALDAHMWTGRCERCHRPPNGTFAPGSPLDHMAEPAAQPPAKKSRYAWARAAGFSSAML
jgi:hypothetical protein